MRRTWSLLLAPALLAVLATPCAQAAVAGAVVVAYQRLAAKFAVMSPDGSGRTFVNCGGDLTHGASPRYFLSLVTGPNLIPARNFGSGGPYPNTELVASDEDCVRTVQLTYEGNKIFGGSRWSPDGSRIAVHASSYDIASGDLQQNGIFLADVVRDAGRPVALANLRLAIPTGAERNFEWAPDGRRIVYVEAGSDGADLFVYDTDLGTSVNITNTAGVAEDQPAWSVTGRIAYTRQIGEPRGGYRYDLFSIPETGGPEFRITSKGTTGAFANMMPAYSPDGTQIAFSSGPIQGDRALYRIKADGTGKPFKMAGGKGEDWRRSFWRD
jgi:dipeptidyl aminopeptidase/acylaminoacyl peptidase